MRVTVNHAIDQLTPYLEHLREAQIPYASADAINTVSYKITKKLWPKVVNDTFEGGAIPFTQGGGRYHKAFKKRPSAILYFDKKRERYLLPMLRGGKIVGGPKTPGRESVAITTPRPGLPKVGILKLNKYGNIPGLSRGRLKKLSNRKDTFRATIGGVDGVWRRLKPTRRRKKGTIQLLLAYNFKWDYEPKLLQPILNSVQQTLQRDFTPEMSRSLRKAVKKNPGMAARKARAFAAKMNRGK